MSAAPEPRPRMRARYSLRLRVFAAVTVSTLLLPLVVFIASQLERRVPVGLWQKTLEATDEAALTVEAYANPDASRFVAIAAKYNARIRVVPRVEGEPPIDADRDDPRDALHPIEAFFFLNRSRATSKDFDPVTPVLARPETSYAIAKGLYIDCFKDELRVCRAVRAPKDREGRTYVVYVDKSSARAVEEVYYVRRALLRLSLVTVPFALLIGAWAARRVTMPIENLRREALEKARGESPGANLTEHADDVGDLAVAMNTLLDAIARRRADHEAFVADVVHEMKSPVAAITAVAEALESPVDDARRARLAKALSTSGKKLDDLVTHFLELARAEAGMPREEREEVDVARLVRLETERAKDDVRYTQVDVVCRVPDGPVPVRGVARRLSAVVRELVDNAAQFAGDGGHVEVRLSSTTKLVVLEVEDDGPGIAEADLPKVFQRFFTTRGEKRGTGLGLALVHAVAQAHGGRAEVVSPVREGRGTTFRLTLPAA